MSKIEIRNLTVDYTEKKNRFTALKDVSFSIEDGEFVSVIGSSGCGKSTLLRTLLRLIEPTEGTITYHGEDITHLTKKQMKKYTEARSSSSRRFCKAHRMQLAQADIKYVMKLPIGPNGKMVQCYICSIIDDHSKMILGTGVYDSQEAYIVEDVYRRAILSYGAFDATYVDYTDVLTIPKFLKSPPSSGCFSKNIGIVF